MYFNKNKDSFPVGTLINHSNKTLTAAGWIFVVPKTFMCAPSPQPCTSIYKYATPAFVCFSVWFFLLGRYSLCFSKAAYAVKAISASDYLMPLPMFPEPEVTLCHIWQLWPQSSVLHTSATTLKPLSKVNDNDYLDTIQWSAGNFGSWHSFGCYFDMDRPLANAFLFSVCCLSSHLFFTCLIG